MSQHKLQEKWPIVTSFVAWTICWSVCLSVIVYSAKTDEASEMMFGLVSGVSRRNYVL